MKSKALRARTSWLLAIVLIPPFIFFLFSSSPVSGRRADVAGTLFGKPVPLDRYRTHYQLTRRQWAAQFAGPDGRPMVIPDSLEPLLAQTVWDRLLLIEEAKARRLRITDQELAEVIRRTPSFQVDGRFQPERYEQFVAAMGLRPPAYEDLVREQLLIDRLVDHAKQDVLVTDADVKAEFIKANERLVAPLVVIQAQDFEEVARQTVTDEEARADYDAHPEHVQHPAQVTFRYAGLSREEAGRSVTIADAQIAQYYDAHRADFTQGDSVRPLEAAREEIRARLAERPIARRLSGLALDLQDALKAGGATFDQLVSAHGLATGTAGPVAVGDLTAPGLPDPAVASAAFALETGKLSEVIEGPTGVYLVQVTERTAPETPPFDAVREVIRQRLGQARAGGLAHERADALRLELMKRLAGGEAFEQLAETLTLDVQQPMPFTRTEPVGGFPQAPGLNAAAFEVVRGEVSRTVETDHGYVLAVPRECQPPDDTKFSEQREPLRQRLLEERQNAAFEEWLKVLRERANVQSFLEAKEAPTP